MDVIPVIDLMAGEVVHARRGERDAYRPIVSGLTEGSAPLAICRALMSLAPFRRLYVADLDAIRGQGSNDPAITEIGRAFPELEVWVDRGESDPRALARRVEAGPGRSVVGSESFADEAALKAAIDVSRGVLSLDSDAGGRRGPAAIHEQAQDWPDEVIVMTLARVGADSGPDYARLDEVVRLGAGRSIYAAGGVRNADDLRRLSAIGVAGALIASALHDGRLTREELAEALRG